MSPSTTVDIEMGNIASASVDDGLEPKPMAIVPPQPNCWGQCCGRIIKDWTQVVGGLLVTGGLGAGGAGIALDEPLVIVGGAVAILASSILMCVRISCLKPKKELERQVQALGDEVSRLTRNEAKLKQRWQDLVKVLGEAESSIVKLGDVLRVPVDRIENITEQIAAIEEKMRALVDLYHRYKAATEAFSRDLKLFRESNKVTKSHISELGKGVKNLDQQEDELSEEVDQFEGAAEFHRQQNAELRKMLSGFKTDFVAMQKRFVAMQEALAELRQHVIKIDEADDKFRDGGHGFQQGVDQAKTEVIPRLQAMLDKLEKEVGQLAQDSSKSLLLDEDEDDDDPVLRIVVHKGDSDDDDEGGVSRAASSSHSGERSNH